ncbi:acetyltransferase [Lunatibacter salilacus]|uniref:acetyltransferase n=1 Tax=Lunatibacter salilacus TaxID=2483804 RepID=UPI00131ED09A|nr:acetyltransferase [Lunatibacter salilacus]
MKKSISLIIIGAGGHAAELDDYIYVANQSVSGEVNYSILGYLDDDAESYSRYAFSAPYLGSIQEHQVQSDTAYLMGIANLKHRKNITLDFLARGGHFLSFIHPSANISRTTVIGEGVVIAPHVNLGPNTCIGDHTIINSRCSIGHDTVVGAFNFLTPNVCLSGFTVVGDENLFGINSATIPNIQVGSRNKIMAGMTLDKNVGDDEVVFYRFKEKVIATVK